MPYATVTAEPGTLIWTSFPPAAAGRAKARRHSAAARAEALVRKRELLDRPSQTFRQTDILRMFPLDGRRCGAARSRDRARECVARLPRLREAATRDQITASGESHA